MKHNPTNFCKAAIALFVLAFISIDASAQTNPFWNTNGNAATNGNFLGTTNNEPLIFKTNGLEALRVKPNGEIKIASFENIGKGIVTFNNNGVLTNRVFPNDTNQVFCGSGNFKSVAALSGWTRTGNVLYNSPGVKVGIGTSNPQYLLDVNGDAYFNGYVYATGVVLANKMLVDTLKAGNMFSLNNNLHMSAGSVNEIYTTTGTLRFQSNAGNNANTIFSAGTNGNVGIGTFNPAYKLDVNGDVALRGKTSVYRLVSSIGDSIVRIGDSTLFINYGNNTIYASNTGTQGIGIGQFTSSTGFSACAIGYRVHASQTVSIAMGTGVINGQQLNNTIPYSLMVGFNSDKPTLFVGPANGLGTFGKVGIGTSAPTALVQVGSAGKRITLDQSGTNSQGFMSTIGFNVAYDPTTNRYVSYGDGQQNSGSSITLDNEGALRFYVFSNASGSDQSIDLVHFETQSILTLRNDRVQIGQKELLPTSPFNTPDTKLTVDGRIVCQDLVVSDVDWQDEVFDSTYYLLPLDSVASYIKTNGHLPGVKDEKVVEQNGVSVSETVTMQQQKIEELTLYIIQLDARMKAIEEENAKLKEEQQPK